MSTCTSSIYTTTYDQIQRDFDASPLICALGLSTFVFGISFGPLLTAPLSEYYGRRPIYLVSWSAFIVWTIPSAVAQNMETLTVTRFFDGLTGSSFLSVAGGTVGDIFHTDDIQKPMVLISLAPFIGPSIGPILGGLINFYLDWRWTYYIALIWATFVLVAIILAAPETYHPVLLKSKAQKLRDATGDIRYWAPAENFDRSSRRIVALSLLRPFQLLFLEPMCLSLNIYSAILLGILYIFFAKLPETFRTTHSMNLWQSCLTFLGIIIGMLFGAATTPAWIRIRRQLMTRREKETGEAGVSEPEYQLPPAIVGGILVPIGLFWFAWTIRSDVHWLVPIAGSAFFGCG